MRYLNSRQFQFVLFLFKKSGESMLEYKPHFHILLRSGKCLQTPYYLSILSVSKTKMRYIIFSIFKAFLISSAGSLLPSKKSKNIFCGKNTAIIRWPLRRVTALQVVRTSFLYPRPRLFNPAPPPPRPHFPGMKQLEDWLITGLATVSSPTECGVCCRSPFSALE